MTDPLFWLVLSLLFVTVSLTIVLVVAIPALRELARASRSAEKLFDTLRREFPPTLQAIRLTGLEISDLTDDVSEGVQSAGQVAKQVDQSLTDVRQQAQRVQSTTRSVVVGIRAAWRAFTRSPKPQRRTVDRRLPAPRPDAEFGTVAREPAYTNEALLDLRTQARQVLSELELSQNMIDRSADASRDPNRTSTSESKTAASTAKAERLRSNSAQPDASCLADPQHDPDPTLPSSPPQNR